MTIQLAFFDLDGTLSAPRYVGADGVPVIGFPVDEWKSFTAEKQEHSYDACRPVPYVQSFAENLKKKGVRLFVLSLTLYPGETLGKHRFIETWYPGLFEEVITVDHSEDKPAVIIDLAEKNHLKPENCLLIEDSLPALYQAIASGIRCCHVANIAAGTAESLIDGAL